MKIKFFNYIAVALFSLSFLTACSDDDGQGTILKNDCIKRTLGPNLVGNQIEFAYAMALPSDAGKLNSAWIEASIPGATGTYIDNKSYYTNSSGVDVGVVVGNTSETSGNKTQINFSVDTCAATLRYYYVIPEEARGKTVSFTFNAKASNGETVSYQSVPYEISKMDIKLDLNPVDNGACYLSIEDMTFYTAAQAAANPGKIDLVYLYRTITGVTFSHALVSPAATEYLPGVTLPSGVNKSTLVRKEYELQDRHLARLEHGLYIDDPDFQALNFANATNFALNLKLHFGLWVETQDGKYRAYIFFNNVDNGKKSAVVSIKRYQMK